MYALGDRSHKNLEKVHHRLVNVVNFALTIVTIDFSVFEGVRSIEDEKINITKGVSKLKNPTDCQHCIQSDGFGHAVDLVPYIGGKFSWDWDNIYPIALAMQISAEHLGVRLRWGGVWDKCLNDLEKDMKTEVREYTVRHTGKDFIDGPHYEIDKSDMIFHKLKGEGLIA